MFDIQEDDDDMPSHPEYAESWKQAMQEAYAVVRHQAKKSAERGKKHYDKKTYGACLDIGDRVLVRNVSERGGTGKLRSYWENDVYVVVGKKSPDIPVYTVETESKRVKKKVRVLHRNLLLPCDHLPPDDLEQKDENVRPTRRKQKNSVGSRTRTVKRDQEKEDDSSSDDELEQLQLATQELWRMRELEEVADNIVGGRDVDFGEGEVRDDEGSGGDMAELVVDSDTEKVESLVREGGKESDSEGEVDVVLESTGVDTDCSVSDSDGESGDESGFGVNGGSGGEGGEPIAYSDTGDIGHPDSDSTDDADDNQDSSSEDEDHYLSRRKPERNRVAPKRLQYDEVGTPTLRR